MGDHASEVEPSIQEGSTPTDINLTPMGITLPVIQGTWELKANFIEIILKFYEMSGWDPHKPYVNSNCLVS